jgi:hypothetical protein
MVFSACLLWALPMNPMYWGQCYGERGAALEDAGGIYSRGSVTEMLQQMLDSGKSHARSGHKLPSNQEKY